MNKKNLCFLALVFCFIEMQSAHAEKINLLISVKNEMAYPFLGAIVEVDKKKIGTVDNEGKISAPVDRGVHEIIAYIPGFIFGREKIRIQEWKDFESVDVILKSPDIAMKLSTIRNSRIFPLQFHDFYLSLENRRKQEVRIDAIEDFHVQLPGQEAIDIKEYFSIEKGKLYASPAASESLRRILQNAKDFFKLYLTVKVLGFEKRRLELEQEFMLGKHSLRGKLNPPQAYAQVHVKALPWNYSLAGPVEFYVTTKSDGSFFIPELADGMVELKNESAPWSEKRLALWAVPTTAKYVELQEVE